MFPLDFEKNNYFRCTRRNRRVGCGAVQRLRKAQVGCNSRRRKLREPRRTRGLPFFRKRAPQLPAAEAEDLAKRRRPVLTSASQQDTALSFLSAG